MRAKGLWVGILLLAPMLAAFPTESQAQSIFYYGLQGGRPSFNTPEPVEQGFIDLANGDLHLEIPLGTAAQRGALKTDARLVYDGRIWWTVNNGTSDTWQPTNPNGLQNLAAGWSYAASDYPVALNSAVQITYCGPSNYTEYYGPVASLGGDGTTQTYPIYTRHDFGCGSGNAPSASAYDQESTGAFMSVNDYNNATIIGPSGTSFPNLEGVPASAKDSNGNFFSTDSNHNLVDTLGRTPVSVSKGSNTDTITVLNTEGSTSTYTVTLSAINVSTDFGAPGVTEYSGTIEVITSIQLPDGTSTSFTYDSGTTPGHYGELTGITLRTGGQVDYTWANFSDSYGNRNQWVSSRTSAGGTWAYAPSRISTCNGNTVGCQQEVTETKPSGDKAVYTFTLNNGAWNTETDNDSSSGAFLKKAVTAYDFSNNCPEDALSGWVGACYVRPTQVNASTPGPASTLTTQTQYAYDSIYYGNVTAMKEWSYHTGSPGGTPDRETDYTYLSSTPYISANILNRVTDKVVYQDGVKQAETQTTYDSTGLTPVTGIAHHDDANYGAGNTVRGNPTGVSQWTSGSNYLTTTNHYDTTGQLIKTTDPAGNSTSYSYADNFYDDNGSNPPQGYTPAAPTNAYLTQVTLPLSGTLKYGYYYGTGQRAYSMDPNSQTRYAHYRDPLSRQTQTDDPSGGWTLTAYTSALQTDHYKAVNSASPSTSCTSCVHTEQVLDAWGRASESILASDPAGATTVETTYDGSGRVLTRSNPYRSASDPTYGHETYSYDGLDRVVSDTHADNDVAYTYYGPDVKRGGIETPLCPSGTYGLGYPVFTVDEAGHKSENWTDAFGNVIEADEPDSTGALTLGTCYQHDALNDLTGVAQGGQTRTYSFDGLGRETSEKTPEAGTVNYYFTTSGGTPCAGDPKQVCRRKDARGVSTTYGYDAESRLASKLYTDSTPPAYYYYDEASVTVGGHGYTIANGKGRMTHTSTDSGGAMTVESYDPVGRMQDFWQCTPYNCASGALWDMHDHYEPGGMVDTYVHPAGYYISYSVEGDGRIGAINSGLHDGTHPQQLAEIYYAPQGAVSEIINGCAGTGCNRIEETDDYNNRLERVRSQREDYGNSTAISCAVYNYYGSVGNPTSCVIPSQGTGDDGNVVGQFYQDDVNASLSHTASLAYDPTHRLTSAVAAGSSTYNLAYSYDQFGNMTCTQNQQTQGLCPQYGFNASTNQITNSGYKYDASGDLVSDGAHTYQYDAEGRQVSVDNGTTASYVYNALGERVEKDVGGSCTEYVFDKDGNPLGENNRTSWVDTWVDFQGQHIAHYESDGTYFVHSNSVGTAGMVTDYAGAVIQDELHYPWGQEWTMAGTMTEERFASLHHRDEATNLDPTHFRMYSSDQGRWLTPDPAQADIYNPQSMSQYAYADGNPANGIDPSGLWLAAYGPCTYNEIDFYVNGAFDSSELDLVGCVSNAQQTYIVDRYYNGTPPARDLGGGGAYIGPRPPPQIAPPPPPTVTHSGNYSDFLRCEAAALSFLPGSATGRAVAVTNIVGAGAILNTGSLIYPATAYVFDLAIAMEIRETCIKEVYSPGHF